MDPLDMRSDKVVVFFISIEKIPERKSVSLGIENLLCLESKRPMDVY
jgi:hypothetical protein